jgi:hypothetical protein
MAAPVKKSNTGKLIFVAVALALASVSIAWQFGLFGGDSSKPDPSAPPAVVETAEEKEERLEIEEKVKGYMDEMGEAPAGS